MNEVLTAQMLWLAAGSLIFYTLLFFIDRKWGRRLMYQEFEERERVLARSLMKSEDEFLRKTAMIDVLIAQNQGYAAQLAEMRLGSVDRDERISSLTQEVTRLRQQVADLMHRLEDTKVIDIVAPPPPLPLLIVAVGLDSRLEIDLASLRAVRTTSGMEFRRIEKATLPLLKTALDRERSAGRKSYVHLAVHSGPEGVQLGGAVLNAVDLSEVLEGVQVMLLAGCRSDTVADFLGVVPAVVSMSDDVSMSDASIFARHWWVGIGNRLPPQDALRYALDRSPSAMSEFIVRSW